MQSALPRNLTNVPAPQIQRSVFDRTHGYKTTFDAGYLVPFYLDEVLPGDTFNLKATLFGRLATPIFPIMDNIYLDTQFFFIPLRLLWTNFKRAMGEQDNPSDNTDLTFPVFDRTTYPALGFDVGSIYDYMGLPTLSATATMTFDLSCLPLRAYNLIYNHWYRDQNLQNSVPFSDGDGPDDYADYTLLRRGKRKDYFTGALPWPQKDFGNTPVIPLNDAYVKGIGKETQTFPTAGPVNVYESGASGTTAYGPTAVITSGAANTSFWIDEDPDNTGFPNIHVLASDMAGTINELRQAVQLQRFMERDARGGTRYTEIVYSHFKVHTPDLLWRPEYLGGSSSRINIHPVQQTSETNTTPQGQLAGFGTVVTEPRFSKSFTEHGFIMGIMSARADLNYQNNIDRLWVRSTKLDYYWPEFAHLGEQAILQTEIDFDAGRLQPGLVFGYQERYAEYRYKPNTVTGLFRSNATGTLDAWHLAQDLTAPQLNATFIEENPPIDRVIAVNTEPHFILDSVINLKCVRPMPIMSVPGLMDHF